MFNSLEVKVLYPTWWRWRVSKAQGRHREVGSEGSAEQKREPMNKNRIWGVSAGRVASVPQSPYPSRTQNVDSAVVRGRRLNLPREICAAVDPPRRRDWTDRKVCRSPRRSQHQA